MQQRGISIREIETVMNKGWLIRTAKTGTHGKAYVFSYNKKWLGEYFEEKEVTVYYKIKDKSIILLTAVAKYGKNFPKGR